ncbi:MAG: hypothetical protein LBV38_05210 [Alistipes sp.]|jgi:hypothetical protein|nr:hypothetical protein [Alistipes sp.]
MKKLIILLAVVVASATAASAQNYEHGVGLRLGYGLTLDYKWNFSETNSWEFNLAMPAFNGFMASAAYQWNWPLGDAGIGGQGFNAYAGPAAGVGFLGLPGYRGFMLGIGGHGGIEYKFNAPIAVGIDVKPMVTFVTGNSFSGIWGNGLADIALVARYTF